MLLEAQAIAEQWVTPMRIQHVVDQIRAQRNGAEPDMTWTGDVLGAMKADIAREAEGEIGASEAAWTAIKRKTVTLYKESLGMVTL